MWRQNTRKGWRGITSSSLRSSSVAVGGLRRECPASLICSSSCLREEDIVKLKKTLSLVKLWDSETLTLLPWQKTQTQKSQFPDHHFILPQTPKSDKDINSQHLRLRDLRQSVGHANWELQMGSFVFWPNFMNFDSFLGSQIRYCTWFSWVYASLFLFTQRQKLFSLPL